MTKAHKIKLNPTDEQEAYFMRASGIARFAWNWALARYHELKQAGQKVDWNEIKKEFRAKIDPEFPFVREVTKCAAEEAINDLRKAIHIYFETKKNDPKSKVKFPGQRKRSKKIGGFGLANDKFYVEGSEVYVPRLGKVNMTEQLRFQGTIQAGRIKESGGQWYLTISIECEYRPTKQAFLPFEGESVGIDAGLSCFAVLSKPLPDGQDVIETQDRVRQSERRLARLQRGLGRKQKGSKRRAKWKQRIARWHRRIKNQRSDYIHKFTTQVVLAYPVICVEDLCLKGWVAFNPKSTHDAGIGEMMKQLEYKAEWAGIMIQKVDRFFPSSKLCSVCGYKNEDLTLSDREWTCRQCATDHIRDKNASVNLEMEGLRLLAGRVATSASTLVDGTATQSCVSKVATRSVEARRIKRTLVRT